MAGARRGSQPPLPLGKKVLFALIPCAVLLMAAEGGLRLAGYRSGLSDPYESLVLHRPLFRPRGDAMITAPSRTRFFHPQRFAREKPAGVIRFFAFGGSDTFGYVLPNPSEENYVRLLTDDLAGRFPGFRFEGINVGGLCYASYRLVGLVEEALAYSPDFLVVMCGHNEFLEPRHYSHLTKDASTVGARVRDAVRLAEFVDEAAGRLRGTVGRKTSSNEGRSFLLPREFIGEQYIVRNEDERRWTLEHYRRNLAKMASACEARGVPVFFCTSPANLRDWPPFVSEVADQRTADEQARRLADFNRAYEEGRFAEALAIAENVVTVYANAARFHYAAAKALDAQGRTEDAFAEYVSAKDTDAFPHRAPSVFNDAVRAICGERQCPLVDVEAAFARHARDGIVGADLFLDQCHPTKEGHALIARELGRAIGARFAGEWRAPE